MNIPVKPRWGVMNAFRSESRHEQSALRLFGFSFLLLFLEVGLIRFIPANIQLVSYFTNLVLIATFLGMGVGMVLQARGKDFIVFFAPLIVVLFSALFYFSDEILEFTPAGGEVFYLHNMVASASPRNWSMEQVVVLLFVITTLVFVPLGSGIAREFNKFKPLTAYSINILGSLSGLAVFSVLSWYSLSPMVWFSIGFVYFVLLCVSNKKILATALLFPIALWIVAQLSAVDEKTAEVWSPYYRIDYLDRGWSVELKVNGSIHQFVLNLSDDFVAPNKILADEVKRIKNSYLAPYSFVSSLNEVLIVGAGTGNDVALALEQGARHIDAVEIDPEILNLGKRVHFQKPYDDPRVTVYNDDARAFLKKSDKKYDLIILGTLDSQTLLSGMSSIRLDNYVYTVESFKTIRDHLNSEGIVAVYHQTGKPYVAEKIYGILLEAFGRPPLVKQQVPHLFNYTFVGGWKGNVKDALEAGPIQAKFNQTINYKTGEDGTVLYPFKLPTDDWPYLFLKQPNIPLHYWVVGACIALFSVLIIGGSLWSKEGWGKPDWTLLLLGAGFLLLETKSVTEMSLLFGSTWVVNVLVFSSILIMILLANGLVIRTEKLNPHLQFGLLIFCVLLTYMVPVRELLSLSLPGQWFFGSLMVALPIFFSSILFAVIFRTRGNPAHSLGFNVLGAVFGGLLEYSAMAFGTKSLYLVSLIMYLMAYYMFQKEKAI